MQVCFFVPMVADILFIAVLIACVVLSVGMRKLTHAGGITGGLVAACIYLGAGFTGIAMLGLFFILGTAATSWGAKTKEALGVAEHGGGQRTAGQVLANGGVAAVAGVVAILYPFCSNICSIMMAASLASATSDTLSSELGTVYGRRFYNILTFRKDKRGENGIISAEGSLAGLAGSIAIALVYGLGFGYGIDTIWIITAGFAGNLFDSLLGATLERKHYIGNNFVNFSNTLLAGLLAGLIAL